MTQLKQKTLYQCNTVNSKIVKSIGAWPQKINIAKEKFAKNQNVKLY